MNIDRAGQLWSHGGTGGPARDLNVRPSLAMWWTGSVLETNTNRESTACFVPRLCCLGISENDARRVFLDITANNVLSIQILYMTDKLKNINISHKMLHWIKNYLKNRQALVKTNGIRSKTENLQNGVPQGGVLSPTLFLIFINDIQKQISKKVYPSLHADDLALLCTEEELGTAKIRLQTTRNGISKWASDWGHSVNKTKTTYTVFTLST